MSEDVSNRGTVSFQRRLQKGDVSLMVSMQFEVDPTDMKGTIKRAEDAAFQVKALAYNELGIEFEVDEQGVIREKNAPEQPRDDRPPQNGGGGFKFPLPQRPDHIKDWQWANLVNNPSDWWDNRDESGHNPKGGPDFKHKTDDRKKIYLRPYNGGN